MWTDSNPTHRIARRVAGAVVMATIVAACSSSATNEAAETTTTTAAPTTTTTSSVVSEVETETTIRLVPSADLVSEGHITVGSVQYDFNFECWEAGAGDILALGIGEDPQGDNITQAVVQAFFGQEYVSVLIGEQQVIELAIDRPAELFVQSGTIRGSALRFVNAEGSAGVGEDLGLGSVQVECQSFALGLPEGYLS